MGRSGELERFGDVLAAGERSAVILAGTAGVGKTRLAEECLTVAEARGFATMRVTGGASASRLAFGAVAPLLPLNAGPGLEPADTLARAIDAVVQRGNGRPPVLMVDDAHLLDDGSATLVHQLAATRSAFVVATVRIDAAAPDCVAALWKNELAERIEVAPLGPAHIESLLTEVLGGPVSAAALHQLGEASAGNALYLRELVLAATDSGALRDDDGIWRLHGSMVLSRRLVELVEARIGGVVGADRKILEALAFGEPVGIRCLERLTSAATVDGLEERGLIVVSKDGLRVEARLAHPLYGEVLRARTPELRSQLVRQTLAAQVQEAGARRRDDALRIATWRLETGADLSPELMIEAAATARDGWDFELAARLAEAAVRVGGGIDAALLRGEIAVLQGQGPAAEDQLAALLPGIADDARRARATAARVDNLATVMGRPSAALAVAEAALATVTDPEARDQLSVKRAFGLYMCGRVPEALAVLDPLVDRRRAQVPPSAADLAGMVLLRAGRHAEAVEVVGRGVPTAALGLGLDPGYSAQRRAAVHLGAKLGAGRLLEAKAEAADAYARGVESGSTTVQGVFSLLLARVDLAIGTVASAALHGREARMLLREKGWRLLEGAALAALATADALAGSVELAQAALADADGLGLTEETLYSLELTRAQAWTAAAAGDVAGALRHLGEGAEMARGRGDVALESDLLHDMVRLGCAHDARDRLAGLARATGGELAAARAEHAWAATHGDAAGLSRASSRFEKMGAWLCAAEAAAGAAVVFDRAGERRRATGAGGRAVELARRCEGAATPALRSVRVQSALSGREVEVATLAAGGHTSRDIAARLSVSVRTVENQLQRVYEKLGVAGRVDLPEALSPMGGDQDAG